MNAGASEAFEAWRRPRRKRHRRALASFVSGKRVGGTKRVERKTVHGKKRNPKQRARHNSVAFMAQARRFCHGTI